MKRFMQAIGIAGLLAAAGGCQNAYVDQPLVERLPAEADGVDFFHTLADETITSNDDAMHGLLLFVGEPGEADTYQRRVARLKDRDMLPDGFDEPANMAVSRGTVAYALVETLDIEGGVVLRLLGNRDRYALRELQYLGVFPASSPNQTFSGSEFLDVIGRAEDFERRAQVKTPASQVDVETQPTTPADTTADEYEPIGDTPENASEDAAVDDAAQDAAAADDRDTIVPEQGDRAEAE